jgi:polyisoprenoid-binding protein YceI
MTTTAQRVVPVGAWTTDPVHSTLEFSAKHMVVSSYRARMDDFEATLTGNEDGTARLEGTGRVASVVTGDENLTGHLQSPDFFDAERHPEVRYAATDIARDGDELVVRGELALKGVTGPLELRGSLLGPVATPGDGEAIGLDLRGSFDRTDFGLTWNMTLPGGGVILGTTVTVDARLELRRA